MIPVQKVPNSARRYPRFLTERVVGLMTIRILCNVREETDSVIRYQLIIGR